VIAFVSVLTGAAVWSAGRRFFSPSVGVIAAVLYLWIPWVARVSMTGLIDGVVGCFAFLSLYAALIACGINSGSDDVQTIETTDRRSSTGFFLLAGFLAGASVACKYPALLLVVIPLTIGMGIHLGTRHHDLGARFKPLAAFLLAVAVGCGPWFVKNAVLTGNPTYPLLFEWFGGTSRTDELDRRWRQAHRPQPYPGSTDGNVFSGRQVGYYVGHVLIRSAWLAPVLIPLAALALFAASKTRRELVFCCWLTLRSSISHGGFSRIASIGSGFLLCRSWHCWLVSVRHGKHQRHGATTLSPCWCYLRYMGWHV
jgi:4-amino-4-deoxy-L-arabinose transferase-like glycosyltransferase